MAATPDTSPENELDCDHRHSTNGSTELRASTDDDNKIAAVTCSHSESIHRSTETGCFIQLLYVAILFLQYIFNYVASLFAYILWLCCIIAFQLELAGFVTVPLWRFVALVECNYDKNTKHTKLF